MAKQITPTRPKLSSLARAWNRVRTWLPPSAGGVAKQPLKLIPRVILKDVVLTTPENKIMSFKSIMQKIGEDIKIGYQEVIKYLPAASSLAALIFPGQVGTIAGVVSSVDLIQQTVTTVEQKFAAQGSPTGTGSQKLAQVTAIVSPAVLQLFAKENIPIDNTRITAIINAVVAILNVQTIAA